MVTRRQPPLSVPFFYGWIVVALTFCVNLIAAGTRSAATLLIKPLEAEFGWGRAMVAGPGSLNLLLFGVGAPVAGWLVDRYGVRRVVIYSLGILTAGLVATALIQHWWQLLLFWGLVVGFGTSATPVLAAAVANRWFVKHRGVTIGLLTNGNAAGQMVFLPVLTLVIFATGWRGSMLFMAAVAFGLMTLVALWMRDEPEDVGLERYGLEADAGAASAAARPGPPVSATPVRDAFHSPTFWLLSGGFFVCGVTANGLIGLHLIPHVVEELGIPFFTASLVFGVMGGISFIGTLGAGWLVDRVDARKVLALAYFLRGCSLFLLPHVDTLPGLILFATVYGIDWYATGPATTAIASDTFGRHAVARIFGWIFLAHQLGATFAGYGAGVVYDMFGEYQYAFLAGATMALIAAALVLQISPRASRLTPAPSTA